VTAARLDEKPMVSRRYGSLRIAARKTTIDEARISAVVQGLEALSPGNSWIRPRRFGIVCGP